MPPIGTKAPRIPVPVISATLLKKINEEVSNLPYLPDCPVLQEYFKKRIFFENTKLVLLQADYDSIKSIMPDYCQRPYIPNIDKLIDYYIINYPSYHTLRDRYYGPLLIKVMAHTVDEEKVFQHWFKEFICYLKVKLEALPDLMQVSGTKHASTMTKSTKTNQTNISDFCLEIMGPTNIINNLVFSTMNDDVQVRYHRNKHVKTFINDGAINSLLNYPNIKVELNIGALSPLISFTRTSECSYTRFIVNKYCPSQKSLFEQNSGNNKSKSKLDQRIQSVELVEAKESNAYTYELMNDFMKTLIGLINICREKVSNTRKQELKLILNEFLADIEEINLYNRRVIATNTAVKYTIGSAKYERYRFVKKSDINFIEILQPSITLHFKEFNPIPAIDDQREIYFRQLRYFAQNLNAFEDAVLNENTLKYECTLCGSSYTDSTGIIEHFHKEHEPEVGVVCEKCEISLEVAALAANRWKHICFE